MIFKVPRTETILWSYEMLLWGAVVPCYSMDSILSPWPLELEGFFPYWLYLLLECDSSGVTTLINIGKEKRSGTFAAAAGWTAHALGERECWIP